MKTPYPRRRYTKWTPERAAQLVTLWNDGAKVPAIAETLGTTARAIQKKVWTLRGQAVKRKAGRPRKEP